MKIERTAIIIKPDCKRVLLRPFRQSDEGRILKIIVRILALTEKEVQRELNDLMSLFKSRHHNIENFFFRRYLEIKPHLPTDSSVSIERQLLIGAYFSLEYSLESTALFGPSMIWDPDQSNLNDGERRFILSLRATGEGHISSITFRTGIITADNKIILDKPSPFVAAPEIIPNAHYEKKLFERKLIESGLYHEFSERVIAGLDDSFTLNELQENIEYAIRQHSDRNRGLKTIADGILSLAQSNYEVAFSEDQPLSERIIFPSAPAEMNGIEDARFIAFTDDNGEITYYATYTAYDGKAILPQLLETKDFLHFKINSLTGPEVKNKGFALFPRRINGLYAMLSRQDGENLYLMYSDHIQFWYSKELIVKPTFPWEYVQLGNCGSPIETEAGWLVLSHGVGAVRRYCLGAFLLDLNDPSKVIGRLKQPLLSPDDNEREGYVPNVVYSCGGLINNGHLILPYAMSDYASSFAIVNLDELLTEFSS